jgi:hypothetical protein
MAELSNTETHPVISNQWKMKKFYVFCAVYRVPDCRIIKKLYSYFEICVSM